MKINHEKIINNIIVPIIMLSMFYTLVIFIEVLKVYVFSIHSIFSFLNLKIIFIFSITISAFIAYLIGIYQIYYQKDEKFFKHLNQITRRRKNIKVYLITKRGNKTLMNSFYGKNLSINNKKRKTKRGK